MSDAAVPNLGNSAAAIRPLARPRLISMSLVVSSEQLAAVAASFHPPGVG